MEIKYTLEILTKDIQDIGKLVENLHNSPEGSTLELDLALSKLRNVYDVLSEIRTDISTQRHPFQQAEVVPEVVAAPPEPDPEPDPEPVPEPEVVAATPESVPVAAEPEPDAIEETQEPEPGSGTIAEKFAAESSINENMAGNREQDMESKLMGPPIDNIGRNIGINDRFLIIRELFDGDSDGFGQLIKDLDSAGGLQVASERLSALVSENPKHEGVVILSSLLKRRFSSS